MAVSSTSSGSLKTGVCLSTDRPDNPYNGQVIYETDTNRTLIYDNSAWVVISDPSLLSYSGTGATVTADAMTVAGENVTPYTGRKNLIINGNFDVWQRGTGPFTGSTDYNADRWTINSSGAAVSVTRQSFTDGQTDVPGNPRYFLRLDVTTGNDNCRIIQKIEDVRTCSNETVTVSFWAKGTARSFAAKLRQQFDGSTEVYTDLGSYTPSASWQKFSFTTTLPSVSGKTIGVNSYLGLGLCWQDDASTSAYTCDIAQVQVERGNKATPFEHRSYGEELALCQRYYENFWAAYTGWPYSTSAASFGVNWKVLKRVSPSWTLQSGYVQYGPGGQQNMSSLVGLQTHPQGALVYLTVPSGFTVNSGCVGAVGIHVDAEL